MKKLFTLIVLLTSLLLVIGCQSNDNKKPSSSQPRSKTQTSKGVTSFEIGQTYVRDDGIYFKIVDEDTYVLFRDSASQYKTEQDLDEASSDNEQAMYPLLYFYDCHYIKKGDTYISDSDTETMMTFTTVANYKAGKYSETSDRISKNDPVAIKLGPQGYYLEGGTKPYSHFHKSDKQIPSTKEEFLKQYTYAPETEDDDRY